jgi:hypothetical protein
MTSGTRRDGLMLIGMDLRRLCRPVPADGGAAVR